MLSIVTNLIFINIFFLPSLRVFSVSTILAHHPEAHGIVLKPLTFSTWVTLKSNGSLQLPNSPLDLHTKHLFNNPIKTF